MGKSKNSHSVFGTRGNPQGTLSQGNAERKARELAQNELVKPLIEAGVKFKKEDVLFVTKDKSGQLIWLEKGNDSAGLKHIIKRHNLDFKNKFYIEIKNIFGFINNFITNGDLVYSKVKFLNGRNTIDKIYKKGDNYFLFTAIGINGFIVTAYPIDKNKVQKLIRRNKK